MALRDLTPEFTARIHFTIGEVLPADDPLAQWLVNLARSLNDLMIANARLTAGFIAETPATEHFYDIRQIAVHSWELTEFLRESERDYEEVAEFMATLDGEWRQDYVELLEAFSAPEESDSEGARSFKRALASARDQATHYSRINHKLLTAALKRISDQEGTLLVGKLFKDFRAEFAADLDAQMFFPMRGDEEHFRAFAEQLQETVLKLIRYTRAGIDKYLLDRQEPLVVEEYSA